MNRFIFVKRIYCNAALLLIVSMIFGCGKPAEKSKEQPPTPVEMSEAIQKDTPIYFNAIGNVAAFYTIDIKSRVTGELIRTFFKQGDFLEQGQDLFTIDPAPFEAKVKEIEAKVKQSKVQYDQARREFLRFQTLYTEKAISQEQLETKEVDMNSKRYQYELDQANLETAKLNLGYCYIKSPLAGPSGEIYIDTYNIVNANQDKLVTIKQITPVKVKFSLPGKMLDEIWKYQAKGPLEVEALIPGQDRPETGKLTFVDNIINLRTGMINLEGTMPNNEKRLWPGLFVQVKLKLTVIEQAVLVPYKAILDGMEGRFVWLVDENMKVSMRTIKTDRRVGDLEMVIDGLKSGDKVVSDGMLMLRPGGTVITKEQMAVMMQQMKKSQTAPDSSSEGNRKGK